MGPGGWDARTGVGTPNVGYLHDRLAALAWALAAFAADLGDRMTEVTVTEFGRAVAENANGGVDHGGGQGTLMHGKGRCGGGRHVHGGPASHPVVPDVRRSPHAQLHPESLPEVLPEVLPALSDGVARSCAVDLRVLLVRPRVRARRSPRTS